MASSNGTLAATELLYGRLGIDVRRISYSQFNNPSVNARPLENKPHLAGASI